MPKPGEATKTALAPHTEKNPWLQFLLRLVLGAIVLFAGIILAMLTAFFGGGTGSGLIALWWLATVTIVCWTFAPLVGLLNNHSRTEKRAVSSADKIHKAVLGTILQYRNEQVVDTICPECHTTIDIYKAGFDSTDGKTLIRIRCACSSCNGEY